MNWLYALLLSVYSGLKLWLGYQKEAKENRIREDGKNEHIIEEIHEINKRKRAARSIIKRVLKQEQDASGK